MSKGHTQIGMCKVATYAPIGKLKFHPKNPREISADRLAALKESIQKKGFYEPILVWKKNGVVLAGNHRLRAVRELLEEGFEFVSPKGEINVLPIVVEDMDAETAEAILYETNNSYATWVEDKLREAVKGAEKAASSSWGFTTEQVDAMLTSALEDAEKATKDAKGGGAEEPKATKREAEEKEAMEYLALPSHVHEQLTGVLGEIATMLNDSWMPGNSYSEAAQVLVQALKESDFMDEIKKSLKKDKK